MNKRVGSSTDAHPAHHDGVAWGLSIILPSEEYCGSAKWPERCCGRLHSGAFSTLRAAIARPSGCAFSAPPLERRRRSDARSSARPPPPNGLERHKTSPCSSSTATMTLSSNVDSRKPHHLTSFLHSVARASEPELTLLLVHSRTPPAPLDTVRALSPGRGRQSSAQGFSFSTAGGDTSPGNLPHLNRSHSLVGSPQRRRWPGKRVLARLRRSSRLRIPDSKPLPTPATFFPRPPDRVSGRGEKCSVPLSL